MISVDLKNAEKRQTLKGFGTSACWWSQNLSDETTIDEISDLLYSEKGLNLNIYRYNIGGGWNSNNCRVSNPWRKCESFLVFDDKNEDESYRGDGYDFGKDKNAYTFMKACLAKGTIDTVILFANSPHYSFTSSGQASGSLIHHTCNLPKSNYRRFAEYFLDITEHFIKDGIPVSYISPINEPQWKWGGSNVWQEGCHYEPEEVRDVFHIFAEELEKRNLDIKLYGPESGEIGGLTEEYLKLFKNDKLIMKHLGTFAIHSYHADNNTEIRKSFYSNMVKTNPDIRFDMSEWCELPCKNDTKSIKGALITARIIGNDLSLLGAESWTGWVAVNQITDGKGDGYDYSDGLISATNGFNYYYIAKRYYGFLHFSKFIKIGAKVLNTEYISDNKLNVYTFINPDGQKIAVIVNEGKAEDIIFSADAKHCEIYSTTAKENFHKEFSGNFNKTIHSKAASITTVILW
ncbi:hypothetical protein IMSAG250_00847 [Clostridiales bacterium]|nr:hypothetical protein IMSAG250_00847 [Clostridiales bacterium]